MGEGFSIGPLVSVLVPPASTFSAPVPNKKKRFRDFGGCHEASPRSVYVFQRRVCKPVASLGTALEAHPHVFVGQESAPGPACVIRAVCKGCTILHSVLQRLIGTTIAESRYASTWLGSYRSMGQGMVWQPDLPVSRWCVALFRFYIGISRCLPRDFTSTA